MKIILRSDINGLGKRGDIVEVAKGHGRNYLLPRGLGINASEGAVSQAASMRRRRDLRDAADRDSAQTIASTLVAKVIDIKAKAAGTEGRLFGSVTAADVVAAVLAQTGIELDRKKLSVPDHIKTVGEYNVTAKLHNDVQFGINIKKHNGVGRLNAVQYRLSADEYIYSLINLRGCRGNFGNGAICCCLQLFSQTTDTWF